jgi:hypothetical protein
MPAPDRRHKPIASASVTGAEIGRWRSPKTELSVRISTLAAFLTDLLRQESAPALERRLKRSLSRSSTR